MISEELKKYIEEKVLPMYDENNVGGHGKEHVENVIDRSFELVEAFKLDVNYDMVYVIAAFHDIGYKDDPDNHEQLSSEMFRKFDMSEFFSEEETNIIADAIVDHRASLEYEARSIYGKIVSSADREISVENMLKRSILFQADKHKLEHPTIEDVINYSYKKLSSKYGKGGYAKMYYPDSKYIDYLKRMQELLDDKEKFTKAELEIIDNEIKQELLDILK